MSHDNRPMATCIAGVSCDTNKVEHAHMYRPVATCIAGNHVAIPSNRMKSQNHAIMSEMMHMLVASCLRRKVRSATLHPALVLCTSRHSSARAARNHRTESRSGCLPMRFSNGLWDDTVRQMKKEAPLENGRHVRR